MRTHNFVADPGLAQLASGLQFVSFDIEDVDAEHFRDRQRAGTLRNVSLFPNCRTFRVRLYLGGKRRVIGTTAYGPSAARYADMARLFFWPYRLRDVRPPIEADMNFDLAQAQSDLEHNPGARGLLISIQKHLEASGELKLPDPLLAAKTANRRQVRESRRTVRGDVNFHFSKQGELIAELAGEVRHSFDQVKQAFQHVEADLRELRALITTKPLDFSLPAVDIKSSE